MREERTTLLQGAYPGIVYAADRERTTTLMRTPP
jgi:hypothetical protein